MLFTNWLSKNHSLQIANNMLEAFRHYAMSNPVNNDIGKMHKFFWGNRFFQVTFYNSPEDCGYYSALPNYEELRYILCHIVETSNCHVKYEMYFGFELEKMTFLELFDINYYISSDYVKESTEKHINSIEAQLRETSLI